MTPRSLLALLGRLTAPAARLPESERRRARLLAWLHVALLLLTAVGLVAAVAFNPAGATLRTIYVGLITAFMVVLLAAYALNRSGRYTASAWLTVVAGLMAPWGTALLELNVDRGNFGPLIYTVLPVFLCSILLSAAATILVASTQIIALFFIPLLYPPSTTTNWPNLIMFVLFLSVISVVAAIITQQDMAEIERQSRRLAASEAQLRELSVRDALTGLLNWRYLQETLERELLRAQRAQGALGIIMIDLDHFKRFNDTYGHALGDVLLRELGALLLAQVRGSDVACRYGGEEFILLLPDASPEVTRERAERIRAGASRLVVRQAGRAVEPVTLSIGLAAFPQDGATSEALLKAVDDALYRAKREGRDRIVLAG